MADVLNTTVQHDGKILGREGDQVPGELDDDVVDYMKASNAILTKEERDREVEAESSIIGTGVKTFRNQGPDPAEANDPNLSDREREAHQQRGQRADDAPQTARESRVKAEASKPR